jgi:Hemerythrin HHE cation binding domain
MTSTLPRVTHEHHERLMSHVDHLPAIGDMLLTAPVEEVRPRLDEVNELLNGLLLPHLAAAEANLYPELERLLQNRHSLAPLRQEHEAIRRRAAEVTSLIAAMEGRRPSVGQAVALRRVIYRIYALLKIHLVEEEIHIRLIDRGVAPDAAEVIAAAMDHPVGVH